MAAGRCALSLAAIGRHAARTVLSGSGNPNFPVIYLRPRCYHGKVRLGSNTWGDAEGIVEKHCRMKEKQLYLTTHASNFLLHQHNYCWQIKFRFRATDLNSANTYV